MNQDKVDETMGLFSKDIGIDLGTASVLVYIKGKGVVLREPSVVAMDKNTGKLLKVGTEAQAMLGRTPGNIVAMRPLREGVISDYDMTERMLKEFIKKVTTFSLFKPRLLICVPSGITEVEERAVVDAGIQAGARRAYLIEEPVAAAIGADLLVLLSDIDGLYDSDPHQNPGARIIPTVKNVDDHIYALAGGTGSALGSGGMVTKLNAAVIATSAGCEMVIANGSKPDLLYDIAQGKPVGTRFLKRKV